MSGPPPLAPDERLGRGVFSESQARRAGRGKIQHNIFLERLDAESLSVDRLSQAPPAEIVEIARESARLREQPFCGWAVVTCADAAQDGRNVEATPQLNNQYHADIFLNVPEGSERRDAQKEHANSLASMAMWLAVDEHLRNAQ